VSRRSATGATVAALLFGATAGPLLHGAGAAARTGADASARAGQAPQQLLMRVGDTVRVEGTDVGCQVAERDGEVMVDCRRLTRPVGTYGTFIGDKRALVARYHSRGTAQLVFTARQRASWRACRTTTASAASLAGRNRVISAYSKDPRAASAQRGCR